MFTELRLKTAKMKSLFFICLLSILYGTAVSVILEYFYVSQKMCWKTAQDSCRQRYGDLAAITTEEEYEKVLKVTGQNSILAWIGLNRTAPHVNIWHWSDGEQTNFTKWASREPDDQGQGENCVVMTPYGWRDVGCGGTFSSICSRSFMFVKEEKTWDEALQHCRSHYTDLAFVDSETVLKNEKLPKIDPQTVSVWTGLRFLNGKWFWVNGAPLGSLVSLPSCPIQPYRCGAYNFNTYVWENRDCNEKLNFLCYL